MPSAFLKSLLRDEQGATAIEYGLIAALICLAAITAMQSIGNQVGNSFQNAADIMASV
ncbi:Flp family type IVb pilin [Parerythrobacter aestuarii]|uniref:Flp family type IVb pilin n=1 Tax=Parerythrobacter aestuarii TaxID=3020909 RepID=UPI0024DECBBB|nr:Flp family type IVb pilin [Parerythrobacter aestuarii]